MYRLYDLGVVYFIIAYSRDGSKSCAFHGLKDDKYCCRNKGLLDHFFIPGPDAISLIAKSLREAHQLRSMVRHKWEFLAVSMLKVV